MLKTSWITNSPKTLKGLVLMNMKDESYSLASWAYSGCSGYMVVARGMLSAKQSDTLRDLVPDKISYREAGIRSKLYFHGFYLKNILYSKLKDFYKRSSHE